MFNRKNFVLLHLVFLIILTSGCSSLRPVSRAELDSRKLVGHWTSGGDWMNIYCSGTFAYEIKPGDYIFGLGQLRARKGSGGIINEITSDSFTVGPNFPWKTVNTVQKWPHEVDNSLRMTVDDRQWIRDEDTPCPRD